MPHEILFVPLRGCRRTSMDDFGVEMVRALEQVEAPYLKKLVVKLVERPMILKGLMK